MYCRIVATISQDAAQYALGNLTAVVLGDSRVPPSQRQTLVSRLLDELRRAAAVPGQCQGELEGQLGGSWAAAGRQLQGEPHEAGRG